MRPPEVQAPGAREAAAAIRAFARLAPDAGDGVDAAFGPFRSLLGPPRASLPCGDGEAGMPIGVQLVGRPGEDEALLRLARDMAEQLGEETRR